MDEMALYAIDRTAWLAHVAPNMARRIESDPDAKVTGDWSRMPNDYRAAVWKHLDESQRSRIRALRNAA
jgi:hypothetical protein